MQKNKGSVTDRKAVILLVAAMLLIGIVTVSVLAGIPKDDVPKDVKRFYTSYMEERMKGIDAEVVDQYLHFCDDLYRNAMIDAHDQMYSYKIKSWQSYGDELWAVRVYSTSLQCPDGEEYTNYIGIIDGEYRIILSEIHMPESLIGYLDGEE